MYIIIRKINLGLNLTIRRFLTSRNVFKLHDRGLLQDVFPPPNPQLQKLLLSPQTFYGGFDPTADSLHVGNLLILMTLLHCQRAGHQVIALVGGATAMIGDPSGRNTERLALAAQTVSQNTVSISENIQRIFQNHEKLFWENKGYKDKLKPLILVNNAEWYQKTSIIEFLGLVGRHFRVGTMLGRNSVQTRINSESGISFTEFSYQVLQAYDWFHLLKKYNCHFQIGGSDQMGNIMSGHELISRMGEEEVFGMTVPLVTSETGDKLGKSAGNAIWISPQKTSPFELYQFFIRTKDSDVEKLLKLFTFYPLEEISHIMDKQKRKPELRYAHRKLAEQVTLLVHGEGGLEKAKRTTAALYSNSVEDLAVLKADELMDIFKGATVKELLLEPATSVLSMAMKCNCFGNEDDARRIISAGGFYVNQERCNNYLEFLVPGRHILPNGITLIRVGKKNYYIVRWLQ